MYKRQAYTLTHAAPGVHEVAEIYMAHIPQEVGRSVVVMVDGVSFTHEVTQGDLDAGTIMEQVGSVLAALQTQIDASPDVAISAAVQAPDALVLTADTEDTSFAASQKIPSGIDLIAIGESIKTFTASLQINDIEVSGMVIPATTAAASDAAQVTDFVIPEDNHPDTVGDEISVKVGATTFTHTINQSDLDAEDPLVSVVGALKTLIEADTGLGVTAEAVASDPPKGCLLYTSPSPRD